jgi:lipoprotein LprG
MRPPHPRTRFAALAVVPALLLAGCSEAEEPEASPQERLESAKTVFDETSGVRLTLGTDRLPPEVNGLLNATGVATHDPAFDGAIQVASSGLTADVDVVAVNGDVHAKLPFTSEFAIVDPADYGAPDPSAFVSEDRGFGSLLGVTEDLEEGESVRGGAEVLSTFTGTLSGQVVASIIPSASPQGTFDATFTVDDTDQVDRMILTGPFYPDAGEVTYTVDIDAYDVERDITAP